MVTKQEQIRTKAIEILKSNPQGVRYSELVRAISQALPDMNINHIHGSIWNLNKIMPREVYKADRGLFRDVSFRGTEEAEVIETKIIQEQRAIKEPDFYESFAKYLVNELEECTKAISLGGNKFKDKWGTPDVIGKNESNRSDIIKHETEVISAEIKINDQDLITAFGQACSYKIFSHKVYIVIPKSSSPDDKSRLESLCLIFGIGLILFDSTDVNNPKFEIRVRPLKHEPDSFYLNKYIKLIESELFST